MTPELQEMLAFFRLQKQEAAKAEDDKAKKQKEDLEDAALSKKINKLLAAHRTDQEGEDEHRQMPRRIRSGGGHCSLYAPPGFLPGPPGFGMGGLVAPTWC